MSTLEVNTITPQSGTTLTLGGSGDTISLGSGVSGSGLGKFETQLLHVRDEKSTGTQGGTNSAGDNTRDLNTVVTNEITGASLSSNQITLPSGTFYIEAVAFAYTTDKQRLFLYNTSDSSVVILGNSAFSNDTTQGYAPSFVRGRFTISSSKTFEIRHYMEKVTASTGFGIGTGDGRTEVYADAQIWKVS